MRTVILVPYRGDGGHRDRLWDFICNRLQAHHCDYPIIVGPSPDGPFNRGAAINEAARHEDWDVAVVHDADTWVPPAHLERAVELACGTGTLVAAFTTVVEISQKSTDFILAHADNFVYVPGDDAVIRTSEITTQSSVLAIRRTLWDNIGGFDERFVGWGGEDNAFWKAASIIAGDPLRVQGRAFTCGIHRHWTR